MMMDRQAEIEELLEEMGITGEVQAVYDPSERPFRSLFYPKFNRCFRVILKRQIDGETVTSKPFYVFLGLGWTSITLGHAMLHLVDEAEHDGYRETFDNWKEENDEYVHELKMSGAKAWYRYIRKTYNRLSRFLTPDEYEQLAQVIWS